MTDSQTQTQTPAGDTPSVPISAIVLTKNEETNIEACIRDLSFTDDIVVLDSYSDDDTVKIAESLPNVRVFQRHFDTEYKQRNYGLHDIEYKYPWLYICDADERVPTELVDEMTKLVADKNQTHAAYRLRYKNMYLGKWIKYATSYPVWIIRLVQPDKVTYEKRQTNVHPIVDGSIGELNNHFIHYSFNNGLKHWFEKHNFYSQREGLEGLAVRKAGLPKLSEFRAKDPIVRRRAIKNLSFFLRGRGFFRFLYSYFIRMGFLDGMAGFHYCAMISMYEYWIELKIAEQESHWQTRTDMAARRLAEESAP